jgi:hypothetical protein
MCHNVTTQCDRKVDFNLMTMFFFSEIYIIIVRIPFTAKPACLEPPPQKKISKADPKLGKKKIEIFF